MLAAHLGGRDVQLYPAAGRPLVALHTADAGEGAAVHAALGEACALLVITGLDWQRDLSPWPAPAWRQGGEPFAGAGPEELRLLTRTILPWAEARLPSPPPWRGIAGYSLAGLFALYACYSAPGVFTRGASASGSLWYPGLMDFAAAQQAHPVRFYLSLGSQEKRARNPALRGIQRDTEALAALLARQGTEVAWRLTPGDHFQHTVERTAAAIAYLTAESGPCLPLTPPE